VNEANTVAIQGTLDMLILTAVNLAPLHGFGIARRIEQISQGVFKVNPGSYLTENQPADWSRRVSAISRLLKAEA